MRGSKDGTADRSKQQEVGRALFPRLHVAETKKAGPRGPPRNKMALYEQLTVPSHKFKPSPVALPTSGRTMTNPATPAPMYLPQMQSGSFDSMYSYMPMNYMNPAGFPTMACVPTMSSGLYSVESTSSFNTSSSKNTGMDGPTGPLVGSAVAQTPKSSSHTKQHAPPKKGRGDDDFAVPTYSLGTQLSGQTRSSGPLQRYGSKRGEQSLHIDKDLTLDKRSVEYVNQARRITIEKSVEVISGKGRGDACWPTTSRECLNDYTIDNDLASQITRHSGLERVPLECIGGYVKPNAHKVRQDEKQMQKNEARGNVIDLVDVSDTQLATSPISTVHRADSSRAASEQDIISNISSENLSEEVSESSFQRGGSNTEIGSSMLESGATDSVQFRDVVNAFGQQDFWKTQKVIIRQQKLFSRQAFELHRIIEVQQLLGKILCPSHIGEDAADEQEDVLVPASPIAEVPEVSEEPAIAEAPQVPEVSEVSDRRVEANVGWSSNEPSRPVSQLFLTPIYPLPMHSQQSFTPEAMWQAAPYGANPWAARIASPYTYIPYPPPYPPGYGSYHMMGSPMPMHGHPGAVSAVRFPAWPHPGVSQPWSPQESAAVAAWYGQQVVPGIPPTPSTGLIPASCNIERLASSGVSGQSVQSVAQLEKTRSVAESVKASATRSNKGDSLEGSDWVKGWRREEQQGHGNRNSVDKNNAVGAVLRENETDCPGDVGCGGGETGEDDVSCGVQNKSSEGVHELNREDVELKSEAARQDEGISPPRPSKYMRTEGSLEPGASRWFPILSPRRRPTHQYGVIKAMPRAISDTPESAANILLSIQTEKWR